MLKNESAPVTAITGAQDPQYWDDCQGCYLDYTSPSVLRLMTADAGTMPTPTYSGYTFSRCPLCGRDGHFTVNGGRWCCECGTPVHGDIYDYLTLMHHVTSRRDALVYGQVM